MVPVDARTLDADEHLLRDPSHTEARRLLARAAYHAGEFDLAEWHYTALLERVPNDTYAKSRLAWALRRQGNHQRELDIYQDILSEQPAHLLSLSGAAAALGRLGRLSAARDTFDALQILAPTSPLTELTSATLEAIQHRDGAALSSIERALVDQEQLDVEMQIEFRHDIAIDPVFARIRKTTKLRSMLRRHLGAAAPRTYRQ